ncbi:MAG: AraC family transcriptional regulator [Eubacterium sp.]|nr:AraC family transcriptional regulator [Eubacterium sp.]
MREVIDTDMEEKEKESFMEWRKEFKIPSDDEREDGCLVYCDLLPGLKVLDIDIRSQKIPQFDFLGKKNSMPDRNQPILFINCAFEGRCELSLMNGELTYLEGGELALDTGQVSHASSNFCYPRAAYRGVELFLFPDRFRENVKIRNTAFDTGTIILNRTSESTVPLISHADSRIKDEMKIFSEDIRGGADRLLLILDALKIVYCIGETDYSEQIQRQFFSAAQVQIAKDTMKLISEDLSIRYSAAELARRFQISESSLKNYFKGVYGCGYREYQNEIRMKKAAELLAEDRTKVSDIALAVGFSSQSRFARAFGSYFGMSPLEYRRSEAVRRNRKQ